MTFIHEVQASILEIQVYEALGPGDQPVEATASLLDLQSDVLPCAHSLRQRGARAFGFLSFKAASPGWPSRGVLWVQCENGVELMPEGGDAGLLDDPGLFNLCVQITGAFLDALANRDPKYSMLPPPSVH